MVELMLPFASGDTIVELGGGDRPVTLEGLNVVNVDKRSLPTVNIVRDLESDFSDLGSYDGLFACYVAEHVSWMNIPRFFKSCFNILKDGKCAVFIVPNTYEQVKLLASKSDWGSSDVCMLFGTQDYDDNTHKCGWTPDSLTKLLRDAGFGKIEIHEHPECKTDMIAYAWRIPIATKQTDGLKKINFGSFTVFAEHGWLNTDIIDLSELAKQRGVLFQQHDSTKPMPLGDNEIDLIRSDHMIEHLTRDEGKFFLGECHRILKPSGVIRFSTPDLEKLISAIPKFKDIYSSINVEVSNAMDNSDAFWNLLTNGHKTVYAYGDLERIFKDAGFVNVERMEYGASRSKVIQAETVDSFKEVSFYIEAEKPSKSDSPEIVKVGNYNSTKSEPIHQYLEGVIREGVQ